MSLISKYSVLFEFPKENDQQIIKLILCGYNQNILNYGIAKCLVSIFSAYLEYTELM